MLVVGVAVCKPIQDWALMCPSGRSWLGNLSESAVFGLQTQPGFHTDPVIGQILAGFSRVPPQCIPTVGNSPFIYTPMTTDSGFVNSVILGR